MGRKRLPRYRSTWATSCGTPGRADCKVWDKMVSTASRSLLIGPTNELAMRAGERVRVMANSPRQKGISLPFSESSNLFECYEREERASISPNEGPATAATFLFEPNLLDGHFAIDRLAHVIDREGGNTRGGE